MKIYSVIVTYGNRFNLLKRVIESALKEGVSKIIVIDNNSIKESKDKLLEFEKELGKEKLKVVYLDDNYGSAGGYKRGLEEAYNDSECDYIWLLDDDNEPQKDSLVVLKEFWTKLKQKNKNEKISLLSYRKDRITYKEAITSNKPDLVLGKRNSFLAFHVVDIPRKILKIIKSKFNISKPLDDKNITSGKVSVAPYGGMFFHKNIINTILFPCEDFYLYADDHEWSYRITKNDGDIYLLINSKIEDIDTSWNISNEHKNSFKTIATGNKFRMYYSTRNRVFFECENLVTNRIIYKLNIFLFKCLIKVFNKSNDNCKVFTNAVNDGLNKKLGKNEDIRL